MSDRVAATQQTADVGRRLEMHAHEMTSRIEESRRNDRDRLRLLELVCKNTVRASRKGRPRPSGRLRGRKNGSRTAHCLSVRSMPSSTTAIVTLFQAAFRFMRQVLVSCMAYLSRRC